MTPPSRKPGNLRVFYAPGPGHVIGTFIHWKSGRSEPFEPAITYSSQFYEVCRELGAQARVVTACPHRGFLEEGLFRIEHRPHRLRSASGIWFHIGQIWNGMRLIVRAIRFRADVFIVAEGSHWFLFSLLCLAGIRVVPSLQSRVYGSASGQGFVPRMVAKLNGCFFRRGCHAIISMPHELPEQVDRLTGHRPPPIVEFLPQYDPDTFASTSPASFSVRPFRVLYVGRIERSKGVFDLLAVARRFGHEGRDEVEFDLCGGGSALDELRQAAKQGGVAERLRCHGHCETLRLRRMFASAHVVIIPTRTESGEGFNKTSIEAVLCGRPVITSRAWTAWVPFIAEAVVEARPDDVDSYYEAIAALLRDEALYRSKVGACLRVRGQFLDRDLGYAAALRRVLATLGDGCPPKAFQIPRRPVASGCDCRKMVGA